MNLIERPKIVDIIDVRTEIKNVKTLYFRYKSIKVNPGQFFMVWDFREEIPLSVSYITGSDIFGITVKKVGETTEHLISLKKGDKIGIRGPFGNSFKLIEEGKVLIVAGGIGIAPIMPLIQNLISKQNITTTCILGAKSADEILFLENLQVIQSKFFILKICTDDGTMGHHGMATDLAAEMLEEEKFNIIYTCGPELMMKKVFDLSKKHKITLQACLERIIKCGIGICGQCTLDPLGLRVCKDGPVFNDNQLSKLYDFGRFKRDFSGHKEEFK